jgi:hypothetical protein
MRRNKLLLSFIVTVSILLPASPRAGSQTHDAASLLDRVQDPSQTDGATSQLLKMANTSGDTRELLAKRLPSLIEIGPMRSRLQHTHIDEVWLNNVKIAGTLKIAETAPALAEWISTENIVPGDTGGLTSASNFSRQPAGLALIQIGDPAVPALQWVLEHGEANDRWLAVRALIRIGTPKAKSVVHEAAQDESDPNLASHMK